MAEGGIRSAKKTKRRMRAATQRIGGEFPGFDLLADLLEGGSDGVGELIARVGGRKEVTMGADQAGKSGGDQAEGAQVIDSLPIGLGLAQGEDALHGLANEGDLGLEVEGEGAFFRGNKGGCLSGVRAVHKGILIARLPGAATFRECRGGHGTIIAQMFFKCKRLVCTRSRG
jgi:hypothetical protein